MKIAIFGAGGVGSYFGGRLAQAGEEVTFISRGEHLQAIRENELRVESILGDFSIHPAHATADPADIGPVDLVIVGVKAWQVTQAAEAMKPLIGPRTMVLPLENGISAPAELEAVLGREHVLGGLCRISVLIAAPGVVRHVAIQPVVVFGELDGKPSERTEALKKTFDKCHGLTAQVAADIHAALWQKFIFIVSVSGLGAATRQPMGGFRSVPETRRLLQAALEEVEALARAKGIALPEDIVAKTLGFIDSTPPNTYASMQNDLMNGRPSELESQTGTVVRMGKELGVPTPVNEFLYSILLPMEIKAREGKSG
jgi:2-dehydropantoate 2-reductase